jgi:hypothetical protein
VRRLTAWIGGTAAGVAAYRLLRRRSQVAAEPAPAPDATEADTRADELREKLAESRTAEPATEPVAEEEPESPDERRQRVHEEGRAALDEMKTDDSG